LGKVGERLGVGGRVRAKEGGLVVERRGRWRVGQNLTKRGTANNTSNPTRIHM